MNLAIVVGTRPQFVKLSALLPAARRHGLKHFVVTTGQHYHDRLSGSILKELRLPRIGHDLRIRDLRDHVHLSRIAHVCDPSTPEIYMGVDKLRPILVERRATHVLVIGDSNPALVGARAARELGLPIIHCEAGLRSGDPDNQEEHNQILVDHYATAHFCSTERDRDRLKDEEPGSSPVFTGDLLVDVFEQFRGISRKPPGWPALSPGERVCLLTVHRTETARRPSRMTQILENIIRCWDGRVVWPVHPGMDQFASKLIGMLPDKLSSRVTLLDPATYLELNYIKQRSQLVVTDSVGLQVEAYLWKVPSSHPAQRNGTRPTHARRGIIPAQTRRSGETGRCALCVEQDGNGHLGRLLCGAVHDLRKKRRSRLHASAHGKNERQPKDIEARLETEARR